MLYSASVVTNSAKAEKLIEVHAAKDGDTMNVRKTKPMSGILLLTSNKEDYLISLVLKNSFFYLSK